MPNCQDNGNSDPTTGTYRRACGECTASKRRCTKQIPVCQRCNLKELQCIYPPTRRSDVLPFEMHNNPESMDANELVEVDVLGRSDLPGLDNMLPNADGHLSSPRTICHNTSQAIISQTPWFLTSDSWEIKHSSSDQPSEWSGEETLKAYTAAVLGWLRQWITESQCPFIHRQLYRLQMPKCIQDAFMVLTAYVKKTSSTQDTVFRIIEDRANDFVQQDATRLLMGPVTLTMAEHIARVQALLILQVLALFDGDIRLRAQAELRMSILDSWNQQMWQTAKFEVQNEDVISAAPTKMGTVPRLWNVWCFIESVRRTWLTTSIFMSVYMTMRNGYSSCPGGVHCTFGSGLWNAMSSRNWEDALGQEKQRFFMNSLDVGDLFIDSNPGEVDGFGHAVMLVSYGEEKTEAWMADFSI